MKKSAMLARTKRQTLGKLPVVILPLGEYERMKEDLEMLQSKGLKRKIQRARRDVKQGKVVSLEEVIKKLGLS